MNTVVSSAAQAVDSEKRVRIDLVGVYKDNDLLEENLETTKDKLDNIKKKSSFMQSEHILEVQKEAMEAKKLKDAVEMNRGKLGNTSYLYGYGRDSDDEGDEFCQVFDELMAADEETPASAASKLKKHIFTPKTPKNMFIYFNFEIANRLAEKRERRDNFVTVVKTEIEGVQSAAGANRRVQSALPAVQTKKHTIEIDERTGRVIPTRNKPIVVPSRPVRSRRNLEEISNQDLARILAKRQKDPWVELRKHNLQRQREEKETIDARMIKFVKNLETFNKRCRSTGLEKLVSG